MNNSKLWYKIVMQNGRITLLDLNGHVPERIAEKNQSTQNAPEFI
jgi:hypothetical protein